MSEPRISDARLQTMLSLAEPRDTRELVLDLRDARARIAELEAALLLAGIVNCPAHGFYNESDICKDCGAPPCEVCECACVPRGSPDE